MGYYDVMQVCLNGHTINDTAQSHPQFSKPYCDKCGEQTITHCPSCNHPIEGEYQSDAIVFRLHLKEAPAYCGQCGGEFPWTKQRKQAAIELFAEESSTTSEDVDEFEQCLQELTKESPRGPVATNRMRNLLAKVSEGTSFAIREVVIDVLSEAARKALF